MNSRLQDGFIEDFLNSQDGRSTPKCSHHVRLQTRQEKRVEATQNLFDVSSKMKHVISELNHIYTVFSSNKPLSHRDIKSSCYIIKHTIIPFLEKTYVAVENNASTLSPTPGAKYVHNRNKTTSKRKLDMEMKLSNTKKRVALQVLQSDLNSKDHYLPLPKKNPVRKKTPNDPPRYYSFFVVYQTKK